eukprot:2508627-Pyramimonas_sp.AAC.1
MVGTRQQVVSADSLGPALALRRSRSQTRQSRSTKVSATATSKASASSQRCLQRPGCAIISLENCAKVLRTPSVESIFKIAGNN